MKGEIVMLRNSEASRDVGQILRGVPLRMTTGARRRSYRNRRGIALIWFAILGMVLVGLAGLALDTGYVMLTGHQLQNAADAAALAGANSVAFDTAQSVTDAVAT